MKELKDYLEYRQGRLHWKKSPRNGINVGDYADTSISHKKTSHPYRITGFNKKRYPTHRIIFYLQYNYWPDVVDHINNNSLDNRIENLRAATKADNARNSRLSKRNTSGYKGVTWNKSRQKWQAGITINKRYKNLGYYKNIADAIEARNIEARRIHGDFFKT